MAVYWITGLSGAGKTTIGREYYLYLKSSKENVVFLEYTRKFKNPLKSSKSLENSSLEF